MKPKRVTYKTQGDVRGTCGHAHRTIQGAVACMVRDCSRCARVGGYSDRHVTRTDNAPLSELESEELDILLGYIPGSPQYYRLKG